jgi:arylsulfatase A-like enzyme
MSTAKRSSSPLSPLGTALWAGLAWGLLFGLIDNVPCLTQGDMFSNTRMHLQAALYTTVLYTLAFTLAAGALGLLITLVLAILRRPASPPHMLGCFFGLLAGATAAACWLQSNSVLKLPLDNRNRPLAIALCALLGAILGAIVGWVVYRAGRWWFDGTASRRPFLNRLGRWSVPVIALAGTLLLLGLGLYRNVLRDVLYRPAGEAATAERPNIILITIDTVRADHLGAYGYDPAISPNIDALARKGVLFRQAISQSPWTLTSVCSTITSMYPTELEIFVRPGAVPQTHLDEMRTTLAEALHAGGYRTQAYMTNAWLVPENGVDQGFENFVGIRFAEPFDQNQLLKHPLLALAADSWPDLWPLLLKSHELLFDPRLTTAEDRRYVTTYGMDYIRLHRNERFFLWLYYMDVHTTYTPSDPFPSAPPGISPEELDRLEHLDFWPLVDNGPRLVPPEELPAFVSLYDGEIHGVDYWIGQLTAELERQGLADRTVIVLHSDHGEEFLDHGGFVHGTTLYDELVRVPLIIAGPAVAAPGRVVDTPVRLLDVMPTLLDIAGVPVPQEAQGRSLVPLLQGQDMEEVPIYSEMLHTTAFDRKAVRYQGWKLIYGFVDEKVELYDLRSDPREQVNLAGAEPQRVDEYLRLLRRWLSQSIKAAETLPRSEPPAPMDESVREMLRQGGY